MENKQFDINVISVGNDALPSKRQAVGKYEALFSSLRPGMCLRMPEEFVWRIAGALDSWIEKQGKKQQYMARSMKHYPGAKIGETGRVWLLPREETKEQKLKRVA